MSRAAGAAGEQRACRELQRRGLQLLDRNFSSRYGEIDLVMRSADCLVFVEVRQRQSRNYGGAEASVTASKQQRLIRTAQLWLQQHPKLAAQPCRFDVVGLDGSVDDGAFDWIQAAFEAG